MTFFTYTIWKRIVVLHYGIAEDTHFMKYDCQQIKSMQHPGDVSAQNYFMECPETGYAPDNHIYIYIYDKKCFKR